jgi:hypothetical protein
VKISLAIRDVRDAEAALVESLAAIGERHRDDHDVFHLSRTLIDVHRSNLEALAPFADRYGAESGEARDFEPAPGGEDGLRLLRDLRRLHLLYAEASIDWVLLGQGAQAIRDADLLDTVARCHAQTLRGLQWTVTRLKAAAPQALAG